MGGQLSLNISKFLYFCTLFKQLTADRWPLLHLATGHLRLIISSRRPFISRLFLLIDFHMRSQKDEISQYFADVLPENRIQKTN